MWLCEAKTSKQLKVTASEIGIVGQRRNFGEPGQSGVSPALGRGPQHAEAITQKAAEQIGKPATSVDGVHHAAHTAVDVPALGADLYVCSPYKFFGPHCALLGATPEVLESIEPDKLLPSTDMVPERFEFGTLPYEVLAGATAAVDFIASLAPDTGTRRERLLAANELIDGH